MAAKLTSVRLSLVLLAIGVLLGFWDILTGRRLWPGDQDTISKRIGFAWSERRATIVGSVFTIASMVVELSEG